MLRSLALLMLLAAPATAQDIRPQEATRLAAFDTHFGTAMRQAMAEGSRGDVDLLQEALSGLAIPALRTSLEGDWKCRTIKMGGLVGLTTYAPFNCRFTADGNGFIFEKLTGSQRTIGRVAIQDGQMIYVGVGYVADATPTPYADLPDGDWGDGEQQPQVAVVEQSDGDRARLMFPAPTVESLFDLLYLTR